MGPLTAGRCRSLDELVAVRDMPVAKRDKKLDAVVVVEGVKEWRE